ncbi:MAG: hypothetical protein V7609_3349 [Verrucomicrobiota bacterium]
MPKRKPTSAAKRTSGKARAKVQRQPGLDEITRSAAFQRASIDAQSYVEDPRRLRKLFEDAVEKINHIPRGPFAETWPYLMAMIRLIRAYHRGDHRDISPRNLLILVAALIYFVSPFDVIPDWVPVFGHIDDAFVVSLALKSVRGDLDTFMAWETSKL